MSECDRAILARARLFIYDIYDFAERLLSELSSELGEAYSPEREVAESVVRFLRNPGNVYLSYYPATPVYVVAVVFAQVVTYGPRELRRARAPQVTFIVLYESCKRLTDAELRYVIAHEVAHAAVEDDEVTADLFASVLAARYPERFEMPVAVDERGLRVVDAVELERFSRERPRDFMRRLLRCSVRLRPVRV
jgi:hypothetical protein